MQTTTHPTAERGQQFTLTAETAADRELLDAIDIDGFRSAVHTHTQRTSAGAGYIATGITLAVDRKHPQALEAQAARQALGALRQLFCLGLGEPAGNRHISADAANPQAQEQLTAHLEKLEFMLQALGEVISQQGAVLQKMQCAHGASVGETAIVAQQGGAA